MKKFILNISFFILFIPLTGFSQQFPLTTQYVTYPYLINPAMAGYYGYSEFYLNYRREWAKIPQGPQTFRLSGYFPLHGDKMWLGTDIYKDHSGAIDRIKASISYSYILKTGDAQNLFFGVWANFFQNTFSLLNLTGVDPSDPIFNNKSIINGTTYNAGFGIVYNLLNFNVGFVMPNAFNDNAVYNYTGKLNFKMQREFLFHVSNLFSLNAYFDMKTMAVFRKTTNEPGNFDISITSIYLKRLWLGLLYRNTGSFAVNAGGYIGRGWSVASSYELGVGGFNKYGGYTYEITLSYRLGMAGNRFFQNRSGPVYYKKRVKRDWNRTSRPRILDYRY